MNFDSVRTYLHGVAVFVVSLTGTTAVMFRQGNEWVSAYVVLVSFVLYYLTWMHAMTETFHHDILIGGVIWWLWVVYGMIWPSEFTSLATLKGLVLTGTGLGASLSPTKRRLWILLFTLSLFVPTDLVQEMEPWDGFLHVSVYLCTYYFQYYTKVYLEETMDLYIHLVQSSWILYVSKWFVPFVGIQWMSYAYQLSNKLSAPVQDDEERPPVYVPTDPRLHKATSSTPPKARLRPSGGTSSTPPPTAQLSVAARLQALSQGVNVV